ncbi:MAG: hypothetical protein IJZ74_04570 [Clostridia bacterium]|nr:hypothetical protein [Clostridia bacterium]
MNITELTLVQTRLNMLIKQPLTVAARQADMLCLSFGEQGTTLRIQCYYRMMEQGGVILARNDVYQPAESMWQMWEQMGYEHDYIPEDFRSDEPGANRLDECLDRLNADLSGMTVQTVMLNHLGDMTLCFACGATLNVLLDTSGGEECWRLMDESGETDDLVVYGDGVELVRPESAE